MAGSIVHGWINQQVADIERRCTQAIGVIVRAASMRDVIRASHIPVQPEMRAIRNTITGLRRLKVAVELRLDELLAKQLAEIQKAETAEDALKLKGQFLSREWEYLRGDYAMHYRKADSAARQIIHSKQVNANMQKAQ